jgi:hypothetical protein
MSLLAIEMIKVMFDDDQLAFPHTRGKMQLNRQRGIRATVATGTQGLTGHRLAHQSP